MPCEKSGELTFTFDTRQKETFKYRRWDSVGEITVDLKD